MTVSAARPIPMAMLLAGASVRCSTTGKAKFSSYYSNCVDIPTEVSHMPD